MVENGHFEPSAVTYGFWDPKTAEGESGMISERRSANSMCAVCVCVSREHSFIIFPDAAQRYPYKKGVYLLFECNPHSTYCMICAFNKQIFEARLDRQ